ncbi:MAG TPA: SRPBCC family protein [Mycobacteriales bacterium]|nr:SRPBCC family protein [Mycobacteriales bacterium]
MPDVSVSQSIACDPQTVYRLVSDVTRMGEWSPETVSCRWLAGAPGPVVGARFKGTNRKGFRRWSTTCTVTEAEPGRQFAFRVASGPMPVALWSYEFADDGAGCRVTESWVDRRPSFLRRLAGPVMGVRSYPEHTERGMRSTLAALARAAESTRG